MAAVVAMKIHGENVGRSLRKKYGEASLPSWEDTGKHFHLVYRPKRFTQAHAAEANYGKRLKSYNMRKLRKYGHTYPLVLTGEVKRLVATASITARKGTGQLGNQGGVKVAYRGARKLNLRSAKTEINMADEFTRVTEQEAMTLGQYWQARFNPRFLE